MSFSSFSYTKRCTIVRPLLKFYIKDKLKD